MPNPLLLVPQITDEDIEWVCDLMQLDALDQPRKAFLAARSTLDVSACPGSGKTTLVIAKLAILARKWPHRTKGICVLSHTNVAREEIEIRLGSTVVGQRLLRYPHFIDTIHGFVNRFLALPWLNSNGFPSPTVDNDVTTAFRRGTLTKSEYWAIQNFLIKKYSSFDLLRICARDLSFNLCGRAFPAGTDARSFSLAKKAVQTAAQAGYFCYDEMFIWAHALLEDLPSTASWLRCRFPLVIIDEMQDTFEAQGTILHKVFPRSSHDIVVQRVGDPNQAIFDDSAGKPDQNDPFPDSNPAFSLDIPNSFRFGPEIAALASPFAVIPVGTDGLNGIGPKTTNSAPTTGHHTIFIFPDSSTVGVLDAYGRHVLATFDDNALEYGKVTAIGAVHQDALDVTPGHAHFPKTVPHYWSGYTADITRKDPHPKTLALYFRAAQAAVWTGGNLSQGVERIATGLIRLAGLIGDASQLRRKTHRAIADTIGTDINKVAIYHRLLKAILIDRILLTEECWHAMQEDILTISYALCSGVTDIANSKDFLVWSEDEPAVAACIPASSDDAAPNIYRVFDKGRRVDIQLGSIHSVKGQTHLATMVLDTFWHAHSSQCMLPWLLGLKVNLAGAGNRDRTRLLQTYVAMTRPTHLICLAAPRSTFGDDQTLSEHLSTLETLGWFVAEIIDGDIRWHTQ
jgi:hypothetical protein